MRCLIPENEVTFRVSRSGGPGGQHVNKTSTRVEALWNVRRSESPTAAQRARLLEQLASRIDSSGVLRVVAADSRSQAQNRTAALARLQALVDNALYEPPPRRQTTVPRAEREARLEEKRRRSALRKHRRPPEPDD